MEDCSSAYNIRCVHLEKGSRIYFSLRGLDKTVILRAMRLAPTRQLSLTALLRLPYESNRVVVRLGRVALCRRIFATCPHRDFAIPAAQLVPTTAKSSGVAGARHDDHGLSSVLMERGCDFLEHVHIVVCHGKPTQVEPLTCQAANDLDSRLRDTFGDASG